MKTEPSQVQRIVWLDAIRLFAMFGVILVHVSSGLVMHYFDAHRRSYW